jgi:hypothetical protein
MSKIFGVFHITWKINSKWEGRYGYLNDTSKKPIEEF